MILQQTVTRLISDVGQIFKPPVRMTVTEAVCKYFRLPEGGRFDIEITPYMRMPMDALTNRKIKTIIFAGPARTGKSLALISGSIVYIVTCNPSDTLVVHMTETAIRKYSRLTVSRMIRKSPKLKALLSPSKDDDNVLTKFFRNGMALILGYPSPTQLSAADYKFVLVTDYDRMPDDNGEGSVAEQAGKRTQTFMSAGCTVIESSPGRDLTDVEWAKSSPHEAPPVGGILGLYNEGDRHLQYWKCPHCAKDFPLYPGLELFCLPEYEDLLAELKSKGALITARKYNKIYCTSCGVEIDSTLKAELNSTHEWKPETNIPNETMSFWLSGYAAAFQSWVEILEKEFKGLLHYDATNSEVKIKTARNLDQSIPFIPMGVLAKLTSNSLSRRVESLGKRVVPKGVRFLIATIDVQKWKFVVHVEGVGVGFEQWTIDRFDISISKRPEVEGSSTMAMVSPPSYQEDWSLITDQVIKARYPLHKDAKGRDMGIILTGCDSGGTEGVTENAYRFWKEVKKQRLDDRFVLLKGLRPSPSAQTNLVRKTILDKSSSSARKAKVVGEQPLWLINTTLYKDMVMSGLKRETAGPGYYHFPDWLPASFFEEIVAERRSPKGWDNPLSRRNEQFDLMQYARAVLKIKLLNHWQSDIDWKSPPPWAAKWNNNSEVSVPEDRNTKAEKDRATKAVVAPSRQVRMRTKRSR